MYFTLIRLYLSTFPRKFCNEYCFTEPLFQAEVLNYSGDLMVPPDQAKRGGKTNFVGKRIKGKGKRRDGDESSDDNDW